MKLNIDINRIFEPIIKGLFRFIIYYGGRGGGKSWGIADALILVSLNFTKRILCTRETLESIEDSVHTLLCDRIKFWRLERFFKITNNGIICKKTGSEFKYKGLNDLRNSFSQSVKSFEGADICWIEEGQSISKKSLRILIPTVRKKGSFFIVSFNPDTIQDAIWNFVENPRPRSFIKKVNYYDNKHCPQELKDEADFCKIYQPDDYENIWEGNPQQQSARNVVKYFTDDNIKDINYCSDLDLHICCDFNVDPMCWLLMHKTEDKYFFFDEIVIENTTTRECATEFCNRYPHHVGNIIINGDASGKSRSTQSEYHNYTLIKNTLQDSGYRKIDFNLRQWNPPIKNRILAFNNKIMTNKGERHIFISPKCKWFLYNIKNLKYKEGTSVLDLPTYSQIASSKDLKYLGHPFDAGSYPVELYHPVIIDYIKAPDRPKTILEQWNSK
jgi:PBSX family phage terminase large subunit